MFRKKGNNQTLMEFARQKEQLFDRWCASGKVGDSYCNLKQLILIEEFKSCIDSGARTFFDEKQVENLEEAARLADDYTLTHKSSFVKSYSTDKKFQSSPDSSKSKTDDVSGTDNASSNKSSDVKDGKKTFSTIKFNYCKKPGHIMSGCYLLKKKEQ